MTANVLQSVDVSAPAGTTWLALTDWTRQGEWLLGTEVHVVAGNGRSVGSRIMAITGLGEVGFTDQMEIVAWEPPVRCTVRHLGTLVKGSGTFHVQAGGETSSTVVWSEQLELPLGPIGKLGWSVLRPAFVLGLRRSLHRFAAFAESYEVGNG